MFGQILYELQQHYRVGKLEDVRIIKDKQTSQSTSPLLQCGV